MDRKSITAVIRWGNGSTTEVCKAIIGSNRSARRTRCASETKRNNAVSVDAPWSPRPSRAGVRNVRHRSSLATFQSGPFKRFGAEPLHTLSTVKRPSDRMPRTAALAGSSSSFMLCRCSLQRRRRKRSVQGMAGIPWKGFIASGGSTPATNRTTAPVVQGLVPVDLVPDRNTALDGTTRPGQVL